MSGNYLPRATHRSFAVLMALLLVVGIGITAGLAPAPRAAAAEDDVTGPTADELRADKGEATGKPVVDRAVRTGKSLPLREIAPTVKSPATKEQPREINPHEPRELPGDFRPASPPTEDPLRQDNQGAAPMPSPIINIEGQSDAENEAVAGTRLVPPDTNGDVGPNHYVQWINVILSIYDKTDGSRVLGPVPGNAIFDGFGGPCETTNRGDPTVLYDQFDDRWVLSQFATPVSAGSSQCVAVSETDDPTGSYFLYEFPTPGNDYPKMGVWGDAYYMTYRSFNVGGDFIQAVALEKDKMLVGDQTAASVRIGIPDMPPDSFEGVLPPHIEGVIPSPAGAPAPYAMAYDDEFFSTDPDPTQDFYKIWHFSVDFANPGNSEITAPIDVSTEEFDANVCGSFVRNCIDQPPPGEGLDPLNAFTMWRAVYHGATDSLWVNSTVDADGNDTAGIRWAQIDNPAGTPTLNQAGTYAPDDGESRWTGSLAVDAAGNMALGYSVSSTETFPSIRYAGRLASDPPGVLGQAETELWAGTGAQTGSSNRWGDYSSMSIDESDGCTFWYTNEYYETTGSFDFHTRIGSFQFLTCVAEEIGTLEGTVTDASTGEPIANATVEAVGTNTFSTTTNENGDYSMTVVADAYDVTASKFAFVSETEPVVVTDGEVTTRDFALDPAPKTTVSGTVTDGSGHGWPLYARIEVGGAPIADVFTDPATGSYSFDVPEGTTVTLTVNAISTGYDAESREITAEPGGQVEDFALPVGASCSAPGYEFVPASGASGVESESASDGQTLDVSPAALGDGSLTTTFASNNGSAGNTFDLDPIVPLFVRGFDVNISPAGGEHTVTIYWKEGTAEGFESDPEAWSVLGSDVVESAGLNQPTHVDVGGLQIFPDTTYGIYVDLEDSGTLRYTNGGPETFSNDELELTTYVGKGRPAFLGGTFSFRMWNGTVHYDIGDFDCSPVPGGLLVGNVRDANTGQGLNDATVTSDDEPSVSTTTFATPDDTSVDAGLYVLFSPLTGTQSFTATKDLYGPDTQTPEVVADDVVVQDFDLPAGLIEPDPASVEVEVLLGDTPTTTLGLNNIGGLDANFEISDVDTTGATSGSGDPQAHFPEEPAVVEHKQDPNLNAGLEETGGDDGDGSDAQSAPPAQAVGEVPAFSTTGFTADGYVTLDAADPSTMTVINPSQPENVYAATFIGNDFSQQYMLATDGPLGANTFGVTDTATGEFTALGTVTGAPAGGTWASMKWDNSTGTLYAMNIVAFGDSQLFTIDPVTLEATLVGSIEGPGVSPSVGVIGIAISPQGLMYGVDISDDVLLAIDKTSGDAAVIGETGVAANFAQDLDFDPTDGTLYWPGYQGGGNSQMFTVDLATGATTPLGDVPGGNELLSFAIALAGDAPWLSEDPTTGTVPAGGSADVDLTFEATPANGITHPGEYTAQLFVSTDTPNEVAPIPVTMTVPPDGFGTFKGTVLGEAGPVPDATVEAMQNGEVIESTTTDVLGRYTLQAPPDTYDLHAFKGDQEAVETGVTVGPDKTVTVNFQVTEGVGTFTGSVTGGPGGPVPDATVEALQDGDVIASATTDVKGKYTLQVPPGTYDLRAVKGSSENTVTDVSVEPDKTVTVNFKLPPGGGLQPR